jgi:hypothetical protein
VGRDVNVGSQRLRRIERLEPVDAVTIVEKWKLVGEKDLAEIAAILKVANFYDFWDFDDSQISRKLILGWDGAVAIPSFRAESRLCDLSGPPAGSWRQYWPG